MIIYSFEKLNFTAPTLPIIFAHRKSGSLEAKARPQLLRQVDGLLDEYSSVLVLVSFAAITNSPQISVTCLP